VEKTKFQVMAEVNAMTSLVSAALTQAYIYQTPEYNEIARRFAVKDSRDPEVREFQANCMRRGIPDKALYNPACWTHEPERTMGAGNKTLEMAIAQQLMQYRNLYDPDSQRKILRDVTLAITDDPDRAEDLVPMDKFQITDSVHDAQLAAGTLMQGLPVQVKSGTNHIEYVDTLMATLAMLIQKGATSMEQIMGMSNIANHIQQRIQLIAQDPEEKDRVKKYGDQLGKLMNVLKAQAQQMQEAMEAQQGQQGGPDAETQAKIQSQMMQSQVKAETTSKAHAQRTAQRQIQFEMQQKQKAEQFQMQMEQERRQAMLDLQSQAADLAIQERKKSSAAEKPASKG
jgi:hypothetical protein